MTSKFPLGQLAMTCGVYDALDTHAFTYPQIQECINRHAAGDWGDVCPEDKASNDQAVTGDARIVSVYTVANQKIYVITEADRSSTTVLLPSEY